MDLTTLFTNFTTTGSTGTTYLDIIIVLIWTFLLSCFIWFVYKKTYNWTKYRQSYVQTIIILPVIISMVMMTVSTNVATAFTMMWALSIIRFRNSLKDTRDLWFVFFAIVVWMSMWVKFYLLWVLGTFLISFLFYFMYKVNLFWEETFNYKILKIKTTNTENFENIFKEILQKYTNSYILDWVQFLPKIFNENWVSIENIELTYKIVTKLEFNSWEFLRELREVNLNNDIILINNYN